MNNKSILKRMLCLLLTLCIIAASAPMVFASTPTSNASDDTGAQSAPVKYSIMDLEWESVSGQTTLLKNESIGVRCPYLSIGSQAHQSNTGFCIQPVSGNGGQADVVIDLTQLDSSVSFFQSLVGPDDFSPVVRPNGVGGSVRYYVLSNAPSLSNPILATTRVLSINEVASLACAIPEGTTKLTLRVTNADGSNHMDYADWIDPCLYRSEADFGSVDKDLYSETNILGNKKLSANASVGVRFAPRQSFSAITLKPNSAEDSLVGNLYKFTYSYTRSIQNGSLCTVKASKDTNGNYVFLLNDDYSAGEYLFVADGVKEILANSSQYGYCFYDGIASRGLINMSVRFTAEADSYLNPVSDEPPTVNSGYNYATAAEKARAKSMYEGYTSDLANFPSTVTIGEDAYTGFGSEDFTLKGKETTEDTQKHCETTVFTLDHKSGLTFILTTVFYPDYAAFDWVIYFTNNGSENSPVVSGLVPANIDFHGDDPTILGNYGEDYDVVAPYTPRNMALSEGETQTFSPLRGRSTDAAFPYYNFEYGNKGALLAVGWSSTWEASFSYQDGTTRFSDKQQTFSSYLTPGEVARTPLTAVVLYDGRDTDRATNLWRHWFIDCNMHRKDGQTLTDPFIAGVTSSVYTEMLYATEENQIGSIDAYVSNGIDLDVWWMDAGWYPEAVQDPVHWLNTGNWTPDTNRFPTKFKAISDKAAENGMKTLLWFEPERVGLSISDLEKLGDTGVKKEWLVGYNEQTNTAYNNPAGVDTRYFQLNLGNKDCLEWLKKQISTVLIEGGISIYREDLNIERTADNYMLYNSTNPNRSGMLENKCVQGHYEYWDYLLSLDNIDLIDSCASGGHRLDLETMRRAVALHPADYNYSDMTAKQIATYGLAQWFPFTGANTSSDTSTVIPYNVRSAYRQALILQYDSQHMNRAQFTKLKEYVDEWHSIEKYFYGDLYQLTKNTVSANEWYAYSYILPEEQEGFALVFDRGGSSSPDKQYIKLKGLDAYSRYDISFADSNKTYNGTGLEFMQRGVEVATSENNSEIIYIKRSTAAADTTAALDKSIARAESLNLSVYSQTSTYEVIQALYAAKATRANDGASISQIQAANENLVSALSKIKPASTSTATVEEITAELGDIIASIGPVTEENYAEKGVLITYAETCKANILKKFGNTTPIVNDDMLTAARAAYNSFVPAPPAPTYAYGDINRDGNVGTADALLALQQAVGKITLDEEQMLLANVDGKPGVTTSDALYILQKAVGKIKEFPIEE